MPLPVSLCLFASTPDIAELGFIVKVLMGSIDELPKIATVPSRRITRDGV